MPNENSPLPPKLESVLLRLVRSSGHINMTRAVKLPYLVDVVATRVLGHPITEGTHQAWEMGVVTREVWHYLDKQGEVSPILRVEPIPLSDEKRVVAVPDGDADALTPDEARVVDFVIDQFSEVRATDLGQMTKIMNPDIRSWGSNHAANLGADAFDRMSEDYQEMAKEAASYTLDRLRQNSTLVHDIEDAIA